MFSAVLIRIPVVCIFLAALVPLSSQRTAAYHEQHIHQCLPRCHISQPMRRKQEPERHGRAPIVTLPEHKAIIGHASPIRPENETR